MNKIFKSLGCLIFIPFITSCDDNTEDKRPTFSPDELPQGHVITPHNRCGQGFSWCEKQQRCLRPMALLKGRDIHDLKKIFEAECAKD